jgi:hypothetical protein
MPLALWIYLGLGLPYALLLLPRAEWSQKINVVTLAFAFGPALLTAWGFVLGTIGGRFQITLLRFDLLLGGTFILALIGIGLIWLKMQSSQPLPSSQTELLFDEKLIGGLIGFLLLIIWLSTTYWPFTAYDTLWVYGYEGRLYTLIGYIPEYIGYYPQFLPLQYNFMQLAVGGYDDHAARVVVPFLYLGSILAAYTLGQRLFSRRVGVFTAAMWAFYPHAAQWAQVGDLEIPLTFLFTLSASYFLQAWTETQKTLRQRYALIAGICLGIAMWTKPTAGAYIWGVMVLAGIAIFLTRFNWKAFYPRFEVALITGLGSIPLGALWYLRNYLLGLPVLVFPHESWLNLATRSGDLLTWPLLALFLLLAHLAGKRKLEHAWILLLGTLLILVGAMPSSPLINLSRRDAPASYIQWYEAITIIAGLGLIGWNLRKYSFPSTIAWAYGLALPYFITWFWSYSYHARLSFAIVPLLILPSAVVLAQIKVQNKIIWGFFIVLISLYSLTMPIFGIAPSHNWLWTDRYPDDASKYMVHNADIYQAALFIDGYEKFYATEPVVIAVGEQRLPFFLPQLQIITDTVPTTYEQLEGATHYLYGSHARWRYQDEGINPMNNRIVASLAREELFHKVYHFDDGNFEYELYELSLETRFQNPEGGPAGHRITDEVIFGDGIRFLGDGISFTQLSGNTIFFTFLWETITAPERDYYLQLSLLNTQNDQIETSWDRRFIENEESDYSTRFWETGEYVTTRHQIVLEDPGSYPAGSNIYRLLLKLVDSETGEILAVTINGELQDAYPLEAWFSNGE